MAVLTSRSFTFLCTLFCAVSFSSFGMGALHDKSDKVLLRDVSVLTLYKDRMTSGRRSSPVAQLTCVGGTAKGQFTPTVVQCYNRGSDGHDIQWECKADMDNAYRFGSVEVTCEGYDYPDDPFILKGSCGLEYTLDFSEEGYQRFKQQRSHNYGGHSNDYHSSYGTWGKKSKSVMGDLLFLGGIALVIYIVYKSCLAPSAQGRADRSAHQPHTDRGDSPPPPYGFRQEFMPGSDSCSGSSSYQSGGHTNSQGQSQTQGGGFWTGAATGGLLGYMFGRNNSHGGYTHHQPYSSWGSGFGRPYTGHNSGWFSGWGSGGGGRTSYGGSSPFSSGGSGGSSFSSGTRTASGFGGTKRR